MHYIFVILGYNSWYRLSLQVSQEACLRVNVSDLVSIQVWIFVTPFHDRWINIFCWRHLFLEILLGNQMPHSPRSPLFGMGTLRKDREFLKCALIFTLDCIGFRELFCKERRQWSIAQENSAKISFHLSKKRKTFLPKRDNWLWSLPGNSQLWTFLSIVFAFYWCRDPLIKCVIYVISNDL